MTIDRLLLHPAANIFLDHLLSQAEDENKRLRDSIVYLTNLVKAELHLHDGHVVSAAPLMGPSILARMSTLVGSFSNSQPRPLSELSAGRVRMMGKTVGNLSGCEILMCLATNDTILLRFVLSRKCFFEVVLRGLSDTSDVSSQQIMLYLKTGVGLQNANAITFTPTVFQTEISPELKNAVFHLFFSSYPHLLSPEINAPSPEPNVDCYALESLYPHRSFEDVKDGLVQEIHHLADGHKPLCKSDELLRLSTVAAVGYTDESLRLLVDNRMLKQNNRFLHPIKKIIGMVEIAHLGLLMNVSLKDGNLHDREGNPVWRLFLTRDLSRMVTRSSMTTIKMFLSGIPLDMGSTNIEDLFAPRGYEATFDDGVVMSGIVHRTDTATSLGSVEITVDFPLRFVQSTL